jgi:predicted RNase H-like HicB family nuclease
MPHAWTKEQKLKVLLTLPWTVVAEPGDEANERVLRVQELPDVIATGTTEDELAADFWESIETYLEEGVRPPLPRELQGLKLPWETSPVPAGFALDVRSTASPRVRPIAATAGVSQPAQRIEVPALATV